MADHGCCASVRVRGMAMYRGAQCSKRGTVKVDGKWYCGVHDPAALKRRQQERHDKFEKYWAAREAAWRREERTLKALAACKEFVSVVATGSLRPAMIEEARRIMRKFPKEDKK